MLSEKRDKILIISICAVVIIAIALIAIIGFSTGAFTKKSTGFVSGGGGGGAVVGINPFENDENILKKDSARLYLNDKYTGIPVYKAEERMYVSVRSFLLKAGFTYDKRAKAYVNKKRNATIQLFVNDRKVISDINGEVKELTVLKYGDSLMIAAKKLAEYGYRYTFTDYTASASGYDEINLYTEDE